MPSSFRLRGRGLAFLAAALVVAAVAWVPTNLHARSRGDDGGSVHGLIVELRDAPTHVALARDRAGALAREGERWQRVAEALHADTALVRDVPLAARTWRRDPVGTRAQVLRFERPLSAAQAQRLAARLAADPAVAWVQPNTRERRMGGANNPPNDPYFPGRAYQWWLQPLSGSDGNALIDRLRGVPDVQTAWLREAGVAATVIAVLDSGITAHPDLAPSRLLPGFDFVADAGYANDGDGRDADPSDPGDWVDAADRARDPGRFGSCEVESSSWHGTVIAGIVAAQTDNGLGAAGMNWAARVLPVRVAGKCGAEVADIVEGMRWAAGLPACKRGDGLGGCAEWAPTNANPARVINISFGGSAACGSAYQGAIDELRAAPGGGAVVVAAAGNEHRGLSRPASCSGAIGVVALNRDGFKSNYSNFGAAAVVATVGGDDVDSSTRWNSLADSGLLSIGNCGATVPRSDCGTAPGQSWYYYHWGTSFSTPVVTGAVSLMLAANPALTADQIVAGLRASARPHVNSTIAGFNVCSDSNPGRCLCTTTTCGAGILDLPQALAYAAAPGSYVAPARQGALINAVDVAAAVALGPDRPPNSATPPPSSGGGGGGGATGGMWLAMLAAAAFSLRRSRMRGSA